MPLSRFTQTLPLDLAEAISLSEAAPVEADFVEVCFGGAGELLAAGALAGVLAEGLIADLFAAGVTGAAAGAAIPESLAVALFFLLFFVVVVAVSALAD